MRHTVDGMARLSGNIEDLTQLAPVERAEIEELADTFVERQEDLRGQIAAALTQLAKEQSVTTKESEPH
jgi:hypothetical protein